MYASNTVAVIPAGGQATNTILRHTSLPDAMLPINGRPVIAYILDDLLTRGIRKVIIALHRQDIYIEPYVTKKFGSKLQITIMRDTERKRGLGNVIYRALAHIGDDEHMLVYLGDTIYRGPLTFDKDFVVTSLEYEHSSRWCFIENNGDTQCFINKPIDYVGTGLALTGIYFIADTRTFKASAHAVDEAHEQYELYHVLSAYPRRFATIQAEGWYDCGNIENYYRARIDFLKTRSFNFIIYNDLYGTITKTGHKKEKIKDEIQWYLNMPQELKVFSPRLINYRADRDITEYTLEYYGYQSLADYFVFNHFEEKVWGLIIDRLFEIMALFKQHATKLPYEYYDQIYRQKTEERLASLRTDPYWDALLKQGRITVNGVQYLGWPHFAEQLSVLTKKIYAVSPMSFIHGDPCLSNILFDPHNRILKFIDPRGSFGTTSVYGDQHYDIAKLRHSFVGRYDFIVSDMFTLVETGNEFHYHTLHEEEHERIGEFFDRALTENNYPLAVIRNIEALLFLSMIPLHGDAPARQRAMFLTGIMLLNTLDV